MEQKSALIYVMRECAPLSVSPTYYIDQVSLIFRVVLDSVFFRADSTLTHVTIQVTQL